MMDQALRRLADQLILVGVAQQAQAGRVDEGDHALLVDAVDAVADRTEDAVEALAFGLDRLLHLDLPRQRFHAREEQLLRLVLEHALDRAGVEALDDDVFAVGAGDDRERRRTGQAGQAAAQLVAVSVRQEVVDDGQVEGFARGFLGRFVERTRGRDRIALAFQQLLVGQAHALRVVDEKDAYPLRRHRDRGNLQRELLGARLQLRERRGNLAELRPQHDQGLAVATLPGVELGTLLVHHQQDRQRALRVGREKIEQGHAIARRPRRHADNEYAVGLSEFERLLEVLDRIQIRRQLAARRQTGSRQGALEQMAQRR
jgi:hypothetical protein